MEKENFLISVIVPIYKVEQYLNRCVDSILAQTYRNIEVILVDDGSPDNCPAICDEYKEKDSRIIVIHKKNGGVADARNAGIDVAKGAYLAFIDSDDWIGESFLADLIAGNVGTDLIRGSGYTVVHANGMQVKRDINECSAITDTPFDFIVNEIWRRSAFPSVCTSLFKKEVIDKYAIRFRAYIRYAEDFYFICEYAQFAQSLKIRPLTAYYYFQRPGSIINSYRPDILQFLVERVEWAKSFLKEKSLVSPETMNALYCYFKQSIPLILMSICNKENKDKFGKKMNDIRQIHAYDKLCRIHRKPFRFLRAYYGSRFYIIFSTILIVASNIGNCYISYVIAKTGCLCYELIKKRRFKAGAK